jgi:hypothetical protein
VRLEIITMLILIGDFFRNLCGMEKAVGLTAGAVPSIPLHGSTSNCHKPPLMILR